MVVMMAAVMAALGMVCLVINFTPRVPSYPPLVSVCVFVRCGGGDGGFGGDGDGRYDGHGGSCGGDMLGVSVVG